MQRCKLLDRQLAVQLRTSGHLRPNFYFLDAGIDEKAAARPDITHESEQSLVTRVEDDAVNALSGRLDSYFLLAQPSLLASLLKNQVAIELGQNQARPITIKVLAIEFDEVNVPSHRYRRPNSFSMSASFSST